MLDDPQLLRARDPGGMLDALETAGAQLRAAAALELPAPLEQPPRLVAVVGMGGSGIAGDVLAALAFDVSRVPTLVLKGRDLPASVGPGSLVACVSFAGDVEEVVAAAELAVARGADAVVVAAGRTLVELADRDRLRAIVLPALDVQPRAAFWTIVTPLVAYGSAIGLMRLDDSDFAAAARALDAAGEELGPGVPLERNPAKQAATRLVGSTPLAIGTGRLGAAAALRFREQCNEMAQVVAAAGGLPESAHNDVMALEGPAPPEVELVVLRDVPGEHPLDRVRLEAACRATGTEEHIERAASRGGPLARLASLVAFADYTSVYLALLRGADPSVVATIDALKAAVAASTREEERHARSR